jgi:polyisoprenoid-binding protein YceI
MLAKHSVLPKLVLFSSVIAVLAVGCSDQATPTTQDTVQEQSITAQNSSDQQDTKGSTIENPASKNKGITIELQDQSSARYIVVEQFANESLSSSAIGKTSAVTGTIQLDNKGEIVAAGSRVIVDLTTLTSDKGRRDNYLRTRLDLGSQQYPSATLVIKEIQGLPWPLPSTGKITFQLTGDLTIREITRQLTWDVAAQIDQSSVTGEASAHFTFDTFDIEKPKLLFILSIEDQIDVVVDFTASLKQTG